MDTSTFMKKYTLFFVFSGRLVWWNSYSRRGNALRYLKEMGSTGLRVMLTRGKQDEWLVMVDGVLSTPDEFTSRLLGELPREYRSRR